MRPLLAPAAVAVVGAGRRPGGIGHATLRSIIEYGFLGPVYAVNPYADTVAGVLAVPSLSDVPGPVDLAVIAVSAPRVASGAGLAAKVCRGLWGSASADRERQQTLFRRLSDLIQRHHTSAGIAGVGLVSTVFFW